ncbi:MAG TPA: hypothetical protein VGE47_06695 [Burkholderiaceae bacterium]
MVGDAMTRWTRARLLFWGLSGLVVPLGLAARNFDEARGTGDFTINAGDCIQRWTKPKSKDPVSLSFRLDLPGVPDEKVRTFLDRFIARKAVITRSADSIFWTGPISAEAVERYEQLAEDFDKPFKLVINTGGGEGGAGIRLAESVAKLGATVKVVGLCASACANYVLSAAAQIELDGVVAFHGSASMCEAEYGVVGGIRRWGFSGWNTMRTSAAREREFHARYGALSKFIEQSGRPDRGDPSGKPAAWLLVRPEDLRAAGKSVKVVSQPSYGQHEDLFVRVGTHPSLGAGRVYVYGT